MSLWEHGTAIGNVTADTATIEHTHHQNNTYQLHVNDTPGLLVEENVIHGIDTTEMVLLSEQALRGQADDARVVGNRLVGASTLVSLTGDGIQVVDNEFDSSGEAHLELSGDGIEIVGNRMEYTVFDGPPRWAIEFYGANALVDGNTIDGYDWFGIWNRGGTGAEIAHNDLTGDSTGIYATSDVLVHNTTIQNSDEGIDVSSDVAGARVENVTVTGAERALNVRADNSTWTHNELSAYTGVGMRVEVANVTVRQTNFDDTGGTGLDALNATDTVDARHNWWGCADGPDDPACDDVGGDAIYDPWLTALNPAAGSS